MNNPIILHINYVEYGYTILEECQRAVTWGYDGIEFRRKRSRVEETPEEYLDAIAAAAKQTGLKHVLFGGPGPNLMTSDAAMRRAEVEECAAFYRAAAKRFPLTVCNTMTGTLVAAGAQYAEYDKNGSAAATEEQWEWAVKGFQTLGDVAAELRFRFAFETHMCYLHDLPEPSRQLVDRIGRKSVGLNFDYGNIVYHAQKPPLDKAIETCGDAIYYLHLKNTFIVSGLKYQNAIPCPLSDGVIDNRALLKQMKRRGYDGPICIEAPRPGDKEHFAVEDITYLKRLMAEV
jgi:sugar phosphate isomerase/epimerase